MNGAPGIAPCGHPGEYVIGRYVRCLKGCDRHNTPRGRIVRVDLVGCMTGNPPMTLASFAIPSYFAGCEMLMCRGVGCGLGFPRSVLAYDRDDNVVLARVVEGREWSAGHPIQPGAPCEFALQINGL